MMSSSSGEEGGNNGLSAAGTYEGITEEILNLVSRGKPKARENGSRVTADDLFGSSSSEDGADDDDAADEEVIPRKVARRAVAPTAKGRSAFQALKGEYSDGLDEDFYGDDEDRAKLLAMTEVEREAILYDRAQARQARAERKELAKKVRDMELMEEKAKRGPSAAVEKKRQGLEALRAARDRKQRRRRGGADDSEDSEYMGSDQQEDGEVVDIFGDDDDDSENDDRYREEEQAVRPKSKAPGRSKRESPKKVTADPVDLELANRLRLSRDMIVKWMYHPDFDELARGALLRLSLGPDGTGQPTYRIVEVRKVVPYFKSYKVDNVSVNKAALLKYGKTEKTFPFMAISNSPFTEGEFTRWHGVFHKEGLPMLSAKTCSAKAQAWEDFLAQPVSDDIVQIMVKAKKEAGSVHRNLITERTHLLNQRTEAEAAGNMEECEQIDHELAEIAKDIEQSQSKRQDNSRLAALAELNKRNRQLNVSIAREAEKITATNREASASGGAVRMDPFSRRKCQPSNFHDFEEDEGKEAQPPAQNPEPIPSKEASSKAQAQTKTVDLFDVHDVDIDIDI